MPARQCLCAGTLHPLDAVDEIRHRLTPLRTLLHIAETARRESHALPEAEDEETTECNSWWDRAVPSEVDAADLPVDLLLAMLVEYETLLVGLIRCVEHESNRSGRE